MCKFFSKDLVNAQDNIPRRGVVPRFSDLEIVSLSITSEAMGIDSECLLFAKLNEYRNEIPNLISRRQYNDRRKLLLSAKLQNDTISLSATPINRRCGFLFRKVSPLSQRVKVRRVGYRGYPRSSTNLFRDVRRNYSSQCST